MFVLLNCALQQKSYLTTFQTSATRIMDNIVDFHHDLMFFLIIIVFLVLWMLLVVIRLYREKNKATIRYKFTHKKRLEQAWTIIPAIFLICVATPSFAIIYSADELINPTLTIKVFGNQWYWTYEYSDYVIRYSADTLVIDSYMLQEDDLIKGAFRLLEVDNRIFLPVAEKIRILVTSKDVIHSWAVPSLGLKIDACPGRLNQIGVRIYRTGVFYGQCSELCGINHAFMPVVVESVYVSDYFNWLVDKYKNN